MLLSRVYPDLGEGIAALTRKVSSDPDGRRGRAKLKTLLGYLVPVLSRVAFRLLFTDPARLKPNADAFTERQVAAARARISSATPGAPRLREARQLLSELFRRAFLNLAPSIPVGLIASELVRRLAQVSADEHTLSDLAALERGLPGNVTTEMDLVMGDVIDRVRPYPAVLELLRTRPPGEALAAAASLEGGAAFLQAWNEFIDRYGMRGPGEVDLSRPRYKDDPAPLIATLLGSSGSARALGEHRARHAALTAEADAATERLVANARRGRFGAVRARVLRRLIRTARAGFGLREHPKFLLVRVLDLVRDVVREAGATLAGRGSLDAADDVFFFSFEEVLIALEASSVKDLRAVVLERRASLRRDAQRSAPFVVASDGEIPALAARTNLPPGAMAGTAASAGVVEGLARVVLDPAAEVLHDGEILVAPHTDPGWTPLFVHAAGLVTEVGGLITHGSVVAREYGIPAVVSVAKATERIRTGQRIRVDGTRGVVEILEGAAS
jgi:pyruvate,water dikinase